MYVETAVLFGLGLLILPSTLSDRLDRAQRKVGRLLLGHRSRSPKPAVVLELGWMPWSRRIVCERARLLGRYLIANDGFIGQLALMQSSLHDSWIHIAADGINLWCADGQPQSKNQWRKVLKAWWRDNMSEAGQAEVECWMAHPDMLHFRPGLFLTQGRHGINTHTNHHSIPVDSSRALARLLQGAQDLRGGDPRRGQAANVKTSFVFCLEEGLVVPETLRHVVYECTTYDDIRNQACVRDALASGRDIFLQRREMWSWNELRMLRQFFLDILERRGQMGRRRRVVSQRGWQRLAEGLWEACSPSGEE